MIFPIWVNSKQRGAGQSRCLQVTALCPGTLSSSLEILIVIITIKVPSSFSPSQYHHRSHHCIHYHDQSPNIYTSILLFVIGYHSQSFQCCTSWETSWTTKVSLCQKILWHDSFYSGHKLFRWHVLLLITKDARSRFSCVFALFSFLWNYHFAV